MPKPTACCYPTSLLGKLANGQFDAILLNGYMNGAAWSGYTAARKLNIPIFIRGDSHLIGRDLETTRAQFKHYILDRFLRGCTGCFAIGKWNREYWRYYGVPEDRIHTTLVAVDNRRFRESAAKSETEVLRLREEWRVKQGDTVFVFCGNLLYHKGVDVLIRAFQKLAAKRRDVHLVVIGEGVEKHKLEKFGGSGQAIHLVGFVNQSKLPAYLAAAHMFVLPSRREPWGLVVKEAMACGLPCIVSDVVGAGPDLVGRPGTGLIFPSEGVGGLAAAMDKGCRPAVRDCWRANTPAIPEAASYETDVAVIAEEACACGTG